MQYLVRQGTNNNIENGNAVQIQTFSDPVDGECWFAFLCSKGDYTDLPFPYICVSAILTYCVLPRAVIQVFTCPTTF